MANILAVGTHPDDIELGAGGAIVSLIDQGHAVTLCDLTNGEPTPHGSPEIRAKETAKANGILGITNRVCLGLQNRWLMDSREARTALAEVYREVKPDVLLIPFHEDAHPDHVEASKIAQAARFAAKYTGTDMKGEPFYPPRLFFYFCIHLKKIIKPAIIFDITDTIDRKLATVRAYHSQFFAGDPERGEKLVKMLHAGAVYYGSLIGTDYGEPFLNLEEIGVKSFDGLLP